ncbi:MetQ/NlpA family ABC transporter substrate-binding protein [Streptomyces sp. PT12]|uniref:MetQ/NlpA family ABC transporter substrate-binding protein n=1 Tax=Streptomyces sp. PT12 TaxID=1510197 RepID=UPI000DE4D57F|nr:MetQ/NlpA family ABC transporter substrate-binding protein [Streptomyces sp. PT12]RBM23962.1 metal ABC transporter substrate-binding protein [Streptomyces sp. PT12]
MGSTRTLRTTGTALAATAALALALTACGTDSDPDTGGGDGGGESSGDAPLNVAAGPVPHAEILNFVREDLAEEAGLDLEVTEFTDYVLPNTALDSGEVDANFFQHKPYLDDFNANQGTDIVPVVNVHLEPLGLYSHTLDSADALADGDTIAVPNDATNEGRALKLLADNGVIELAEGVGVEATLADITDDRGLSFEELEAATLPRALDDFDAAIINGNYALEAGITPADDALVIEDSEGNPYANFLAVRAGDEDDPRITTLAELLNTDEVRQFIEDTYQGSVVPAFGEPAA